MKKQVKVSIITVSFNAVNTIEETIISVINQTYSNIEYIIIDGGSTDGTIDIIKKYADKITYWVSEPDKGIYDAMNKGIEQASGEWINFMNCGDTFYTNTIINEIFNEENFDDIDIIYGNSLFKTEKNDLIACLKSNAPIENLLYEPIYRHGASFIRSKIHKKYIFDLSKSKIYGYALDYYTIHSMYINNCKFKYVDKFIFTYLEEGLSNQPLKTAKYIYKITSQNRFSLSKYKRFIIKTMKFYIKKSFLGSLAYKLNSFIRGYVTNHIISHIPSWNLRKWYYIKMGVKIGRNTILNMTQYIISPEKIYIGKNTHINQGCLIDGRGGIYIGDNVSISHNVTIMTGSHDSNSKYFANKHLPISIKDYVWIGTNATILQNVTLEEGCVVAAGAVVTKNFPPYSIIAGVPAKIIGERSKELSYKCKFTQPFV